MSQRSAAARVMPLHDLHPTPDDLSAEVLSGLRAEPRTLPCKYFYDAEGSKLFDRICELEEYYPTRAEIGILADEAAAIARFVGDEALVIELGSGSSTKTHRLLDALANPAGYVPIDISRAHLTDAADRIARNFPGLPVWPVCADFNRTLDLPTLDASEGQRLVFFPGSTIGNFERPARKALLRRSADLCGSEGGKMLIGIDLIKDTARLERAYDDREGVTAAFNRNLLHRINRELGSDFVPDRFAHEAIFDPVESRVEMHLVSEVDQIVDIEGHRFRFACGERICTEYSYKFTIEGFAQVAAEAGWALEHAFTDPERLFALLLLETT